MLSVPLALFVFTKPLEVKFDMAVMLSVPGISAATKVPQAGAADVVPFPVCVRNFLVTVVLPAKFARVLAPDP